MFLLLYSLKQINHQIHGLSNANEALTRVLAKVDAEKTSLETDLRVEQDFHQRLQTALTNEKEKVSRLQFDVHELTIMKQVEFLLCFFSSSIDLNI